MTRAGLPTATEYGGRLLVTTAPDPTVVPRPMVTPGRMIVPPPIQQSSSMRTGRPYSTNLMRESTLVSWPAQYMLTLGPNWTRSPMMTRLTSRIVRL
ncbi:hypothetical protein CH063_06963 [Colletotrichum higginsianum]|uniref:Uncharacterized protein n=1 Tax=Colletotrichum higginsianum (strain IMI 349063) TaxID=759273 RepID=H1V4G0_COLHI|nr:hypothetical protein CH063_06963 [Colletotrichum higginsianum]